MFVSVSVLKGNLNIIEQHYSQHLILVLHMVSLIVWISNVLRKGRSTYTLLVGESSIVNCNVDNNRLIHWIKEDIFYSKVFDQF